MQSDTIRRSSLPELDDSDEEALGLFNNLDPHPVAESPCAPSPSEESQSRPLGRLTKLKKDAKQEKKKLKRKEKKLRRLQRKVKEMEAGTLSIVTPLKPSKKHKKGKNPLNSDSEAAGSHDAGSSEFSSEDEDKQDIQKELFNLNPDAAEEDDGSSPRKRLKKSGRKLRIQEKEGFRVEELGNDAEFVLGKLEKEYDDEDYSFDDIGRKSKKKRKPKASVPTNEQIMISLKEHGGVVESDAEDGEGREGAGAAYDNGLDMLYAMKDKRKGAIRINNKFFCDLEIDAKDEEAQMPTPENLELELKPKTSTHSSSRFTFLSKAENLKKQRGLESNVNLEEYERSMQERAKKSIAKVVTSMISQDYHDDIELQVRVPIIARGKSADIINNTVFLKSFSSKLDPAEPPAVLPLSKSCAAPAPVPASCFKKDRSRTEFYKQIQEQTLAKKSKQISEEQLKESFKKTNLCELEEARKRNQEKRRKEALSEESEAEEEPDSNENKMEELLAQEERICGDLENEQEQNGQEEKEKPQEVEFIVKLKEAEEDKAEQGKEQQEEMEQEEAEAEAEINAENEIIEELASASHHASEQEEEEQEIEEQVEEQSENEMKVEGGMEQSEPILDEKAVIANQEQRQQQMELQQEGIMLRKRKIADSCKQKHQESKPEATQPQEDQIPHHAFSHSPPEDKQNAINLPNTETAFQSKPALEQKASPPHRMTAEEQDEQFKNFRKLRKFAMVIAEKKKVREQGRRYAAEFIEHEAEEGSDNEDHDDFIKKIDYDAEEQEYEGVDLDADLVELIDNAVDLNEEDEQEAFRKYLEDIRIKDREEIRKIIRGEFRSRQHEDDFDVDEDERRRQERMEEVMNQMKKREEEDGQGIYLKPPSEDQGDDSDFDSDSEYRERKKKKAAVQEEEIDRIPEEEEKAMIERFLENTLPCTKRESRTTKMLDLGTIPESAKLSNGSMNKKIGMSLLGSKSSDCHPLKPKKFSSLANEVFSRNQPPKSSQKMPASKLGRR